MKYFDHLNDFRPNVGICLFNSQGKVWLGERIDTVKTSPYHWQMPQGGIDQGEDYADTAYRELFEETGISSTILLLITPGWLCYEYPKEYRKGKARQWRGQRQKWAAMLFTGSDAEIDVETSAHQEFRDWRWETLENIPSLGAPFKKEVYQEIVDCFVPLRDWITSLP